MNLDLIKLILVVAIASSIISTVTIQNVVSFLISVTVGVLFDLSFSDLSIMYSLWVGLVTWIGADAIYRMFEDKIFKLFVR